jgi:hypothetical protein
MLEIGKNMKKIGFGFFCFLLFWGLGFGWAQSKADLEETQGITIKDYFQPMVLGVKYQYEYLEDYLVGDKKFEMRNIRHRWVKGSIKEFVKSEDVGDGRIQGVYISEVYAFFNLAKFCDSKGTNKDMSYNTFTYILDNESVELVSDVNTLNGKTSTTEYNEYYELKMPRKDAPVEWVNIDGGVLFGEPYKFKIHMTAYFGECKTLIAEYPDCIVVDEVSDLAKERINRSYYAKSVGLVKTETLEKNQSTLGLVLAKIIK